MKESSYGRMTTTLLPSPPFLHSRSAPSLPHSPHGGRRRSAKEEKERRKEQRKEKNKKSGKTATKAGEQYASGVRNFAYERNPREPGITFAGIAEKTPYKQKCGISEASEAQKQSKKKSDATTTSPFSFCFIFRSFFGKTTKVYVFIF